MRLNMRRLANLINTSVDPWLERRVLLCIVVFASILRLALSPIIAAQLGYLPDVLSYRTMAADLLEREFAELSSPTVHHRPRVIA